VLKSAIVMPVFLERFLLPVSVALVIALSMTNPLGFDWTERISGGLAVACAAYFISQTLHKNNLAKISTVTTETSNPDDSPHENRLLPIANRSVTIESNNKLTNSPIITGDNSVVNTDMPKQDR
jgi:hypothetical protein